MEVNFKSPQQQLFDAIFRASLDLGYRTFDYLPANDAGYPFVFIGEQFDQDRRTKQFLFGDVQQTIHVYNSIRNRRETTTMIDRLKVECRKLKRTENFYVTCKNVTGRIIQDDSTPNVLWHGIIEAEFTFH